MRIVTVGASDTSAQQALCRSVAGHLGAAYLPTTLVLDDTDYSGLTGVRDDFLHFAFAWEQGQPIDGVPLPVLDLMTAPGTDSLVWLSRKAMASNDEMFIWIVAHELRHIFQKSNDWRRSALRDAMGDLRRSRIEYLQLPPAFFDPAEMDADLSALRTVRQLLGTKADRYFAAATLPRTPRPAFYRLLCDLSAVHK